MRRDYRNTPRRLLLVAGVVIVLAAGPGARLGAAQAPDPASTAEQVDPTTIAALRQRVTELQALRQQMAALEANLSSDLANAEERAFASRDVQDMVRYESLYQEIQGQLDELRQQQTALSALLERLEATLAQLSPVP